MHILLVADPRPAGLAAGQAPLAASLCPRPVPLPGNVRRFRGNVLGVFSDSDGCLIDMDDTGECEEPAQHDLEGVEAPGGFCDESGQRPRGYVGPQDVGEGLGAAFVGELLHDKEIDGIGPDVGTPTRRAYRVGGPRCCRFRPTSTAACLMLSHDQRGIRNVENLPGSHTDDRGASQIRPTPRTCPRSMLDTHIRGIDTPEGLALAARLAAPLARSAAIPTSRCCRPAPVPARRSGAPAPSPSRSTPQQGLGAHPPRRPARHETAHQDREVRTHVRHPHQTPTPTPRNPLYPRNRDHRR